MDSARTVAAWADVAIVCVGNHPTCDAGWEQAPVISEGKRSRRPPVATTGSRKICFYKLLKLVPIQLEY